MHQTILKPKAKQGRNNGKGKKYVQYTHEKRGTVREVLLSRRVVELSTAPKRSVSISLSSHRGQIPAASSSFSYATLSVGFPSDFDGL